MRLGLLGLGRIGEFHADTLASLPLVDSLVVADIIPSLTKKVAERMVIHLSIARMSGR